MNKWNVEKKKKMFSVERYKVLKTKTFCKREILMSQVMHFFYENAMFL